jgi:hypothetical protein
MSYGAVVNRYWTPKAPRANLNTNLQKSIPLAGKDSNA